jgi:hypothetical protein
VPGGDLVGCEPDPPNVLKGTIETPFSTAMQGTLFMLDARLVRGEPQAVAKLLAKRGFVMDVATIEQIEVRRKLLQLETEQLQNERNTRSKHIGQAKAAGKDIAPLLAEVDSMKDQLDAKSKALEAVQAELDYILQRLPNIPADEVPAGKPVVADLLGLFDTSMAVDEGSALKTGKRKSIPKKIRVETWKNTFGNRMDGACYCCREVLDAMGSWEAGHIISQAEGGPDTADNLRPVCGTCNKSMGKMNMNVFKATYYPS